MTEKQYRLSFIKYVNCEDLDEALEIARKMQWDFAELELRLIGVMEEK